MVTNTTDTRNGNTLMGIKYLKPYYKYRKKHKEHRLLICTRDENGKQQNSILRPTVQFYISKPEFIAVNKTIWHIDEVVPMSFYADQFPNYIMSIFKYYQENISPDDKMRLDYLESCKNFYDSVVTSNDKKLLDILHFKFPFLHGTDIDIADHYYARYSKKYPTEVQYVNKPSIHTFDIENDVINNQGIIQPSVEALSLTNAVTYTDGVNVYAYFTRFSEEYNESQDKFVNADSDYIESFRLRMLDKIREDLPDIKNLILDFFDSEMDLISAFFDLVHTLSPDILGAWNIAYDWQTLEKRIEVNDEDPRQYFCTPSVPEEYKSVWFMEDFKSDSISKKRSSWFSAGTTYWECFMELYNALRPDSKLLDSKLDTVLEYELDTKKVDLGNSTVVTIAYDDYELFMEYSMMDTVRLHRLAIKLDDVNLKHSMSKLYNTRFNKAIVKTIAERNISDAEYKLKDYILSNNRNGLRRNLEFNGYIQPDPNAVSGEFRGAFVADPLKNNRFGIKVNGKISKFVFGRLCDFDYTALYPTMRFLFGIDTLSKKYKLWFHDEEDSNGEDKSTRLSSLISIDDSIMIGHEYLDLPDYEELLELFSDR